MKGNDKIAKVLNVALSMELGVELSLETGPAKRQNSSKLYINNLLLSSFN